MEKVTGYVQIVKVRRPTNNMVTIKDKCICGNEKCKGSKKCQICFNKHGKGALGKLRRDVKWKSIK